jgi:thermitase
VASPGWRGLVFAGRLWIAGVIVMASAPAIAAANDLPPGSLALGHPALESEDVAVGGIVESRVPNPAVAAADEVLVTFAPDAKAGVETRMRSQTDMGVVGRLPHLAVDLIRVRAGDRMRAIEWLSGQHGVESVQPDTIERPDALQCPPAVNCAIPDDPGFSYQWYLDNAPGTTQPPGSPSPVYGADVDAPAAWAQTRGSAVVRIAIVDTGIDAGQPDLAGKVVGAANFTASTTTADLAGHGTHVAGITAASFDNATGIAGMAPNARLLDVKVLAVDANGRTAGDCADVADGIVWAADHGANVINLSLGSPSPCRAMQLAIDYAFAHGALPVAAAGNDGTTSRSYPAAFDHVLSVAATDTDDEIAGFSNRGANWVDVAAPGVGIVSTLPTYDNATGAVGYGYLSGTSMATPIVAGIAALIWDQFPATEANRDVEARILASAQAIPGTGTYWRYGRVDACRAVTANQPPCSGVPPEPPLTSPPPTPPPALAQPAPIGPPLTNPPAIPGMYTGSIGRRGGPLRLVVADRGDALIRLQLTVRVRCQRGPSRAVRVVGLSATKYKRIMSSGKFALRLSPRGTVVRRQQFQLSGTFNTPGRRARGTLRLTGLADNGGRCDSRAINWTARRARPGA